jgi:hypothetical protein
MTLGEDRGEGRGDKTGLSHANMGYTAGLPAEEQRYLFFGSIEIPCVPCTRLLRAFFVTD